jgi:hypothetical protein
MIKDCDYEGVVDQGVGCGVAWEVYGVDWRVAIAQGA